MHLKKELQALKAQSGISAVAMRFSPEMVRATTELMQHVADTQASLVHFQQVMIAQPNEPHGNASPSSLTSAISPNSGVSLPSAAFQLPPTPPAVSPHTLAREVLASLPHLIIPPAAIPTPDGSSQDEREIRDWREAGSSSRRSESPMSECCGGIMDCTGLIESEDEDSAPRRRCHQKTSELRSTSGGSDRTEEAGPCTSRPGCC